VEEVPIIIDRERRNDRGVQALEGAAELPGESRAFAGMGCASVRNAWMSKRWAAREAALGRAKTRPYICLLHLFGFIVFCESLFVVRALSGRPWKERGELGLAAASVTSTSRMERQ